MKICSRISKKKKKKDEAGIGVELVFRIHL